VITVLATSKKDRAFLSGSSVADSSNSAVADD